MENSLNHIGFDQIVKYVFGELSETEHQAMEKIVLENPYYMEQVNNLMDYCDRENINNKEALYSAMATQKELVFNHLKTIKFEEKFEKKLEEKKSRNSNLYLMGLVFLCCLLGAVLWYFQGPTSKENNQNTEPIKETIPPAIDEINYVEETPVEGDKQQPETQPEESTPQERDETQLAIMNNLIYDNDFYNMELPGADPIQLKSPGLNQAYAKREYKKIIPILKEEIPKQEGYEKASSELMLAKSLLFTKEYEEAATLLKEMLPKKETIRLRSEIKWFLARAYLLTDEKESGIVLLEELKDSPYKEQSEALILLILDIE